MRGATGARQFKTRRYQHFNPRAPCGARRNQRRRHAFTTLFQSTRPMRGATCVVRVCRHTLHISIHAPHAGRDWVLREDGSANEGYFNPRAPCGARLGLEVGQLALRQISIHAPHAGRDFGNEVMLPAGFISIHAPHAGRDGCITSRIAVQKNFNPRAPCGARRLSILIWALVMN